MWTCRRLMVKRVIPSVWETSTEIVSKGGQVSKVLGLMTCKNLIPGTLLLITTAQWLNRIWPQVDNSKQLNEQDMLIHKTVTIPNSYTSHQSHLYKTQKKRNMITIKRW